MLTRRSLVQTAGAAALVMPFGGFEVSGARAQGAPLYRFGLIADPQYAPVPPRGTRYYANSLWKVAEAIETLNKENLQFCVTLGDIIDRHWESYAHLLPVYDRLRHGHFFLLGNHDFEVGADYLDAVVRTAGLKRAHYDFKGGGHRFIVINGNEVSLFANRPGSERHKRATEILAALKARNAANAQTWNGGMSEDQFAYVKATLDDARRAGEKVFILGHYPVYPENEHNMWDSERFLDLVTGYENFVAYFCGHNHGGNFGELKGKYFVNLKGMVETATTTAFSIVDVYPDRVELKGFGREENRTLKI